MHLRRLIAAVGLVATLPGAVSGQDIRPGDTLHVEKTLFDRRDAFLAGGFAGLTIAMFPVDRSLALRLQDSSTQANHFLKHASVDLQDLADPGAAIIGVSLYGIGRLTGWKDMADLGLHGTEALALSGAITDLLKGLTGRARPYVSDSTPDHFKLGRGFGNGAYQSFPSGHTTAAFAGAAAALLEANRCVGGHRGSGSWRRRCSEEPRSSASPGCTTTIIGRATSCSVRRSARSRGSRSSGTITVTRTTSSIALCSRRPVMPAPSGGVGLGWSITPCRERLVPAHRLLVSGPAPNLVVDTLHHLAAPNEEPAPLSAH